MKINVSGSKAEQGVQQGTDPRACLSCADQLGTDLESELEPVEIQYWNTGTLSSSTWDISGNCSHFLSSSPNPLNFLALDQPIWAPFYMNAENIALFTLLFLFTCQNYNKAWRDGAQCSCCWHQSTLDIMTNMLRRWGWCSELECVVLWKRPSLWCMTVKMLVWYRLEGSFTSRWRSESNISPHESSVFI